MTVQETSYAAHRQIRKCAPEMRERILTALRESSTGLSDQEIQMATGLHESSERPRRIELVASGEVILAPWTKPTSSGRQAQVWLAARIA